MREILPQTKCEWCGQPAKFGYYWANDGYMSRPLGGKRRSFCGVDCYRTYYGNS